MHSAKHDDPTASERRCDHWRVAEPAAFSTTPNVIVDVGSREELVALRHEAPAAIARDRE
jgi:hypothetical protein